jgi:fructosamine-3-kinase
MLPTQITSYFNKNSFGEVVNKVPVSGGCISNGQILTTKSGMTFFLKSNPNTPADMFAREAEGLTAIRVDNGPAIPKVYLFGQDFILLEDLSPAPKRRDYWSAFGHQLAALHNYTNSQFGFEHDNYIGSTRQVNRWMVDGHQFFAEYRLNFQAQMAFESRLLSKNALKKIESIANQLTELIPSQPPSLLHGDLWSGNAVTDSSGAPALIDPAAHFGWAEAELAMTTLFGAFPSKFFQAYEEIFSLTPDYRERFPIYNLYHLLNHLNIFGRGYLNQVKAVLYRYA